MNLFYTSKTFTKSCTLLTLMQININVIFITVYALPSVRSTKDKHEHSLHEILFTVLFT